MKMYSGAFTKRRLGIVALLLAIVLIASICALCFISYDSAHAFTSSNIGSAVQIDGLVLGDYTTRKDGKVFDGDILDSLYSNITGEKNATLEDVSNAIDKSTLNANIGQKVISASSIRSANGGKDIVLKIDGKDWTVTSLVKVANSSGGSDVVATLWLASSTNFCEWNKWYDKNSSYNYPADMYSSSYLRAYALNSGGKGYVASKGATTLTELEQNPNSTFAKFTMPGVTGSLTDFISKPSQVSYQGTENNYLGGTLGNTGYTLPNEAYGTPKGTVRWHSSGSTNLSLLPSKSGYSDWKDDYIWLPSLTETGVNSSVSGIWGLSDNQRSNTQSHAWLRSTCNYVNGPAHVLNPDGKGVDNATGTIAYTVRPAFHLNLTAVDGAKIREVSHPNDVNIEYTGEEISIDNIAADNKSWYNADRVELSYPSDMINAGEKTVTAKIKSTAKDTAFKCVDNMPVMERQFKINITKKKITPRVELDSNTHVATLVSSGNVYSGDTEANGRAPVFKIQFKRASDGKLFDEPCAEKGSYQVVVTITNECNYEIASSAQFPSYVENGKPISLTKDDIIWLVDNAPVTSTEFNYRGSAYVFSISDKTADGTSLADKGVKIDISKGSDGYTGTYSAENASSNDYTVTVNLINLDDTYEDKVLTFTLTYRINRLNYDLSNTKWNYTSLIFNNTYQSVELENIPSGLKANYLGNSQINVSAGGYTASVYSFDNTNPNYNTPTRGNTSSYDGEFDWELSWNISPYIIDFNWDNIAWTDKNGVSDFIPMLTNHELLKDIITYRYYESDGVTEILLDDIEIDMGNVTVYFVDVILDSSFAGNYVLASEGNHKMFTLGKIRTGVSLSIAESSTVFDGSEQGAVLKIGGNIPLRESDFIIKYYNADDDTPIEGLPVNAGNYVIRVSLKEEHLDNYYILDNAPIRYSILQATIDLSGVHWNYDEANPFQYQRKDGEALPYTVELIGLSEYLQNFVVYGGVCSGSSVDTYNATFDFVGLNTDNFVSFELPESIATKTLNWRIIPRAIAKPAYDGGELIFDNEDKDLFKLLNISEDWAEYFEISVRYNNAVAESFIAKDAGAYVVICNLIAELGNNVTWADGDVFAATAQFTVSPRIITVNGWKGGTIPAPQVDDSELKFINQKYTDINGEEVEYGDIIKTFNSTFRVNLESAFGDNVIIRTAEEVTDWKEFSTPADPNNPPTPIEKPALVSDKMQYNGSALTFEISGYDDTIMSIAGTLTVTDLGDYTVTVRFKDGANYCWADNTRDPVVLTFSVVEHLDNDPNNPGGNDPDGDNKGDSNGGILDKIKNFFDELIEKHFPLWQICTGIVAIILILIFMGKTISYGNKKRAAKKEAKKYNERSYTAAAAMLPIFAADEVLFGLSNKIWSIIAFALVGACVAMFIVMLLTRHSWKKAELLKEQAIEDDIRRKEEANEAKQVAAETKRSAKEQEAEARMMEMQKELEAKRLAMQQEAEARRVAREEEAEARRIAREEELEAKRAAWEEEEREERRRRMHWEEEEREVRRRDNDRREKRYREEYEKREEELFRRDEAMKMMFATMLNNMKADIPRAEENTDIIVDKVIAKLLPAMQQIIPQAMQQMLPQSGDGDKNIVYIPYLAGEGESGVEKKTAQKPSGKIKVKVQEVAATTDEQPVKVYTAEAEPLKEEISTPAEPEHTAPIKTQKDIDDEDTDVDEEWDYDDEEWDIPGAEQEGEEGKQRRRAINFRQRLKFSSDKNRELYTQLKNVFCAQRNVAYRVCGSVEKIKYHNDLIAVIGVAKRSLKLWLALDPAQFDEERYYHKDVSDKVRFASVPMYVKVGSQRALSRAMELLAVLFENFAIEGKRKYAAKPIQELIFTLKGNKLLKDKENKGLLCEAIHVHDADILSDEAAEKCIEYKDIEPIEVGLTANVALDTIDELFRDGQKVTLDKLKEMGVVNSECTGYSVTSGSRLTKPLIICADEFSLPAVKMIALTGGRVIKLKQF